MRSYALFLMVAFAGCASSTELQRRSDAHMTAARQAAAVGDYQVARAEQRKGEYEYQRAVSRARDEGRLPPDPPSTPLPVFEPQMQR